MSKDAPKQEPDRAEQARQDAIAQAEEANRKEQQQKQGK